jgi:hypothetical protein
LYADDVNLLSNGIDIVQKNSGTLSGACKEVGIVINTEKNKHMLLSHLQNAGQIMT